MVNLGRSPVTLLRCASLCLDFHRADMDLITFDGSHTLERAPFRAPLRPGCQGVTSVRGMSSHQHNPFVVLCDHNTDENQGLAYGAMLLYSGNFEATAEYSQYERARLHMGIHTRQFRWTLNAGDCFTTPEAALTCSSEGFGGMSRQLHRAIREHLLRDPWAGKRKPVLVNSWEAAYMDFDMERLLSLARAAADMGVELFVLDDGWFGQRNDDNSSLGDWKVNEKKLPGGLKALSAKLKEMNLSFGLWIEPEMVNENSDLYRAHSEWVLHTPEREYVRARNQLVLDLTRPEVRDYLFTSIRDALKDTDIRYLKWDMNRGLTQVFSASLPPERQGEVYHRYVLGVYELLERFRAEWPEVLIEGCAGGGGRFDAGMLYYCPQIWCSDNTDAVDRLTIQMGTSFAYPPCTMGAHVSAVPNAQNGRVTSMATRGAVALAGTFGYELDLRHLNPEERVVATSQIADYKRYWSLVQNGDYYRLTDAFAPTPYTAWAHIAPDRREAMAILVTGSVRSAAPFRALQLRGLDPDLTYMIESTGEKYTGRQLMEGGYPLPLSLFWGDYQALKLHLIAQ